MKRNMKKKVITKQKETIFFKNTADIQIQVASILPQSTFSTDPVCL